MSAQADRLILLRALVGFLGEKKQFNWWDTSFLDRTGFKFLEITFPRSVLPAAIRSVTEAAKNVHDRHIGVGRVFHLFRLPSDIEEMIHGELKTMDSSVIIPFLENSQAAMDQLRQMGSNESRSAEGPVQIGTQKSIRNRTSIELMAQYYYNAFRTGKTVFPYFIGE